MLTSLHPRTAVTINIQEMQVSTFLWQKNFVEKLNFAGFNFLLSKVFFITAHLFRMGAAWLRLASMLLALHFLMHPFPFPFCWQQFLWLLQQMESFWLTPPWSRQEKYKYRGMQKNTEIQKYSTRVYVFWLTQQDPARPPGRRRWICNAKKCTIICTKIQKYKIQYQGFALYTHTTRSCSAAW